MAAVAKKVAAKKAAVTPPEPVELTFRPKRETKGTYVWDEEEGEDGLVIIGSLYTKKPYFDGFVPDENTVMTVTIQIDQVASD